MRKTILIAAIGLIVAAAASAADKAPPPAQSTAGWTVLFAGDLSDAIYPQGVRSVKDGVLSATVDKNIWTKKQYENFVLELEFKTTPGANSGVIVYGSDLKHWIPKSIEIQLLDDHAVKDLSTPQKWQCGAFYGRHAPTKTAVKKPGEWNRMTITCKGKKLSVTLNGEPINEMDMSKWTSPTKNPDGSEIPGSLSTPAAELPTRGHVGLQGRHGGKPVYFRNVKIKKLD